MKSPTPLNLPGLALALGGALWLLGGVGSPVLAPAALLLLIGLTGLTSRGFAPSTASLAGLGLAAAGWIAVAGAGLAGNGRGDSALAPGLVLLSAGLLLLGSRLMRVPLRRAWQPLPLLLGLLGLLLPMGAGVEGTPGLAVWLVWGIGWLWLGGIAIVERAATAPERA